MKKLLLFVLAAVAFAACEQAPIEEQSVIRQEASETITVGFEGDDDTRIQLNEAQKTVWTKGDLVSVFYRSNANQQWKYDGETGARTAELKRVDAGTATRDMDRVVVVYPYNKDYYINPETYNVQASLPAVQHYLKDSYGLDGNILISSSESDDITLKSVCGWLKLQLTGNGEKVKYITFKGNNGEQVAGELYINSADATAVLTSKMDDADDNNAGDNIVLDDTILTEVTLDCGDGVTLGAEATAFYIALPPQTFDNGFTVEIACDDDTKMVKSSSKELTIERNHIQPMASKEYNAAPSVPYNEIWYTSFNGNVVKPYDTNVFGATIVSNTYSDGKGVITFDGDVTEIGENAFYLYCSSLTSVTIPNSVTEIGNYAFSFCASLTSVNIPDSVTTIGDHAFGWCDSLTSVTIGDSVTTIGAAAFYDCYSLTSVTIGDSVTTIGDGAFYDCYSLRSITIPESVMTIGDRAFVGCNYMAEFNGKFAEDNGRILVVDGELKAFAPAGISEYTIPDSVTAIGNGAFYSCDYLISVNIGDSVTTIGDGAFAYCDRLTSVNIPDSVTTIGDYAFEYCDFLTSIAIPDSVTTIGYCAFQGCDNLTSIAIPDSVTTIGGGAFAYCDYLISVNIGDSVTTIGAAAFYGCDNLTSVYCKATNPPALDGDAVFDCIGSSRKIYVPIKSANAYKSARYWSEYASDIVGYDFENSIVAGTPPYNQIWYTSSDGNVVEPYDTNVFGATIVSNTYSNGKGVITFDGDVTTIGEKAFDWCNSLTSITIPDSVTTIGKRAFYECSRLTSVNIPDSVTTIGNRAFYNCSNLTSVTIGHSVTTIGEDAFGSCISLTIVTIGDSVTTIGRNAFDWCYSLTSVNIPDSVTSIGYSAFYNCDSLTSVNIPDSVTTIGDAAFTHCDHLISVTIGDSVTTIGAAFVHCNSLAEFKGKFAEDNGRILVVDGVLKAFAPAGISEYTIPNSVTTIGDYAFEYCNSLTSVTIPDSVTAIGDGAFAGCEGLTNITIPDSVTTMGLGTFSDCSSLTSATIGDSVTTMLSAFYNCTSLTSVYCRATTPPWIGGTNAFKFNGFGRTIYVPVESVNAYWHDEYWGEYTSDIVGYDFENGTVVEMAPNNQIWYTSYDGNVVEPDNRNAFGASIVSNTYNNGKGVITFSGNVRKIGSYAFNHCGSLTSITIPDSVTTIGDNAFDSCDSLTSVTIPDSVTTIGNEAFSHCYSLTSVTIPDSVTTIGDNAFDSCHNLKSVTIPDSVTTIGDYAFFECYDLAEFNGKFAEDNGRILVVDGVLKAFAPAAGISEYTIPDGVTMIGNGAFASCWSLTSITIPDSVTTIGDLAFYYCGSMVEFKGKFAEDNGRILVVDGVLKAFAPVGVSEYTIPNSVTMIGNSTFTCCWDSLTSITIPDSVTTIGDEAFCGCNRLTSLTIPDSVTTIGEYTFAYCDGLTSVIIGDSVTTIGDYAFYRCKSLTSVYCKATTPPVLGLYVFYESGSGLKIYVPAKYVDAYKEAYWFYDASDIVGYNF